jgi:O-antigen/teichoic acid export membrane protein
MANLFLGIFFNLSFWYKLNDLTRFGAYIALIGSGITVLLNILLVPLYSYAGAAWGRFIAYVVMMWLSYYWGQKHYPVRYEWKKIFLYAILAFAIYAASILIPVQNTPLKLAINTLLLAGFVLTAARLEGKHLFRAAK